MIVRAEHFNLEATLESGQVFGFTKAGAVYSGHVRGVPVTFSQTTGSLKVGGRIGARAVREYFDLDRDLGPVHAFLKNDPALVPALKALKGLRLIRQDSWEALACFIISSNNNVKRIQGIHRHLIARLGQNGAFPTAAAIARTHERTLRELGLGYRAPFLQRTAKFISTNPHTLEMIRRAPYAEAVERVLAFPGIGPKVADCVLLYGFHKLEAFPVDVWIQRIVRKLYFKGRAVSERRTHDFGQKRWGAHAGYVQQYLFHGARTGVL